MRLFYETILTLHDRGFIGGGYNTGKVLIYTGGGGYNNGKWLPITMESGCL